MGLQKNARAFNYNGIRDWGNRIESLPIISERNTFERNFSKFLLI